MSDADARIAGKLTMRPARFARPAMAVAGIAIFFCAAAAFAARGAKGCGAPEYHQFDFFEGDWDTYDVTDSTKIVARNKVTPMLDGCAVREEYSQTDGMRGESFSTYDASRRAWHQSWVTNRGTLLLLDGGIVDNRMEFSATQRESDGRTSLVRVAWWTKGRSVRERAEQSKDSGATWTPMFDIAFRRHAK